MSTSEVRKGQPQLPPDKEIIALCEQQSLAQSSYNHLAYPRDSPTLFIKYGPEKLGMKGEMRNQVFAFEMLNKLPLQDRAEIKIPEVYRVIEEDGMIYVVMEYVKGNTVDWRSADEKKKFHKIARAIELFLSFETEGQSLGPVGGGLIRHPVFKDTVAPLKYNSVDDLQNHMTKVANCPVDNKLKIDFTGERICFCFADLFEGNFIFTDSGTLYVVDYLHASFLPESFMTYALDQPRPVCTAIRDRFHLPQNNLAAMRVAGYYFMISSRSIGLDVDRKKLRAQRKKSMLGYSNDTRLPNNVARGEERNRPISEVDRK